MTSQDSFAPPESTAWNPAVDLCGRHGGIGAALFYRFSQMVSAGVILLLLLIFVFLLKECLPVLVGAVDSGARKPLAWEEARKLDPDALANYLGVGEAELKTFKPDVTQSLVELKRQELAGQTSSESLINAASWKMMMLPHQWHGYDHADFIWQPNSNVPKYNIVPLVLGSLKISLLALLFSVPLAVTAALYVSQMASARIREIMKPAVELLAGIPTVVLGFFGLMVLATVLQGCLGYPIRLNAFVAGAVTALAVIPVVFTVSEDAFSAVPRAHRDAAYLLGASNWHASLYVVLPAAWRGVAAAALLGFGRAIGETMIALMVSGNAFVMSANLFDSARTIPATIGSELAETAMHGPHYRILFMIGALLFLFTFFMNLVGEQIINHVKKYLEGSAVAAPTLPVGNLPL